MRMVVVLGGFPEPLVNPPFETSTGEVWYPDLLLFWVPRPVGLEYDGAHHEDVAQRRLDLRRENSILVQGGLPLLRYDAISVQRERERMVQEICRTSGFAPRCDLDARDFARGPRDLRW